jgi:hypothetical protein
MTIFDYCVENIDRLETFNQPPFSSDNYRKNPFFEIEQFNNCIYEIPTAISRENIIEAFSNNKYYKGFIMSMMWGGISKMPSKNQAGNIRSSHAFKAFSTDKSIIEDVLSIVKDRVKTGNIETAYYLLQNDYKIPGVDVSFFTKILSFISESIDSTHNLLIYDKWTKLIHVTLLYDFKQSENAIGFFGADRLSKLYSLYEGKYYTNLIYPLDNNQFEAFSDYCEKMKLLAKNISEATGIEISPFVLESFLFGKQLRGKVNRNDINPRYWIQQHFADDYLPRLQ